MRPLPSSMMRHCGTGLIVTMSLVMVETNTLPTSGCTSKSTVSLASKKRADTFARRQCSATVRVFSVRTWSPRTRPPTFGRAASRKSGLCEIRFAPGLPKRQLKPKPSNLPSPKNSVSASQRPDAAEQVDRLVAGALRTEVCRHFKNQLFRGRDSWRY